MIGRKAMVWKEEERSRIRAAQMDNLRGLLGGKRMNKAPNARIRELCGLTKEVDERIDEGVLRWLGHVEGMKNDRIAKRVYVGEYAGSDSMGMPRKKWIDSVKGCLRKRGLDVSQTRRVVHDSSEWQGFVRGNAWGINF